MAVRLILKFMSFIYWIIKPKKGVAYGMNCIFFSVTARTLFNSDSIISMALVLSFHCFYSFNASTCSSFRNPKNRPFCAHGYLDSCFASFIILSKVFSLFCGGIGAFYPISRPTTLNSFGC
jgi:hypothetical protein